MPLLEDILTMRTNKNGAYSFFCDHVLSQVVGKSDWKTRGSKALISDMATVSDEAFAILLIENNYDVWHEMVVEDDGVAPVPESSGMDGDDDDDDDGGGGGSGGSGGGDHAAANARKMKVKSKYTLNGAGTKKYQGWTNEGLLRFNHFAALVYANRANDKEKTFEKGELNRQKKLEESKKGSKNKKRKATTEATVYCYIEGQVPHGANTSIDHDHVAT